VLDETSLCHPKIRADFLQRLLVKESCHLKSSTIARFIPILEKKMLREQAAPEEVARMRAEIQMIVAARTASEEAEQRQAAELRSMLAEDVAPDDLWLDYVDPETGSRVYRNVSALARGAVVDDVRAVTERPSERAPPPEAKTSTPLAACSVCAQPTAKVCGGCKCIRFCSRECMKKSWSKHRAKCDTMKRIRGQVQRIKFGGLSGKNASRDEDLARLARHYSGSLQSIKEPSRRANGRLRGKQSKCSNSSCKDRDAVGLRYVYSGAKNYAKESICAHPRPPIGACPSYQRRDIAGESCWLAMLARNCGYWLSFYKNNALSDLAQDKQIERAIHSGIDSLASSKF
jgi:hypothetical protein